MTDREPEVPADVRTFTIETAAYEICDQSMDIADRGGIPSFLWDETTEEMGHLADRGLLRWIKPNEHGWEPWAPNVPAVAPAGEALVQQIAEVLRRSPNGAWLMLPGPHDIAPSFARAVLPLVEAQVAPLRDEVERLRALVGDEDQPGWGGCSRAEAIRQANEFHAGRLLWIDEHDRRRDERDTAESALGRVRKVRDEWAAGCMPVHHKGYIADIDRALAPVGAADTQPEGAGEAPTCSTCDGTGLVDWEPFANRDSEEPQQPCPDCFDGAENAHWIGRTPTAGSNGDTAPEADPWVAEETKYGTIHRCRHCKGVNDWTGHQTDCPAYRAAVARSQAAHGITPADTAPESGEGR